MSRIDDTTPDSTRSRRPPDGARRLLGVLRALIEHREMTITTTEQRLEPYEAARQLLAGRDLPSAATHDDLEPYELVAIDVLRTAPDDAAPDSVDALQRAHPGLIVFLEAYLEAAVATEALSRALALLKVLDAATQAAAVRALHRVVGDTPELADFLREIGAAPLVAAELEGRFLLADARPGDDSRDTVGG